MNLVSVLVVLSYVVCTNAFFKPSSFGITITPYTDSNNKSCPWVVDTIGVIPMSPVNHDVTLADTGYARLKGVFFKNPRKDETQTTIGFYGNCTNKSGTMYRTHCSQDPWVSIDWNNPTPFLSFVGKNLSYQRYIAETKSWNDFKKNDHAVNMANLSYSGRVTWTITNQCLDARVSQDVYMGIVIGNYTKANKTSFYSYGAIAHTNSKASFTNISSSLKTPGMDWKANKDYILTYEYNPGKHSTCKYEHKSKEKFTQDGCGFHLDITPR